MICNVSIYQRLSTLITVKVKKIRFIKTVQFASPCKSSSIILHRKCVIMENVFIAENVRSGTALATGRLMKICSRTWQDLVAFYECQHSHEGGGTDGSLERQSHRMNSLISVASSRAVTGTYVLNASARLSHVASDTLTLNHWKITYRNIMYVPGRRCIPRI